MTSITGKSLASINKYCSKKGHETQRVLMVCINKSCGDNMLCCCCCVDEEHQMHEIVSLTKFEKIIRSRLQLNSKNMQRVKILNKYQEYRSQFIKLIKELENSFLSSLFNIENQISKMFLDVRNSLTLPDESQIIEDLLENMQSKNWRDALEKTELCTKYKIGTAKDSFKMLDHQIFLFDSNIEDIKTELAEKMNQIKSQVSSMNFNSVHYQSPPAFHSIFRYFDMFKLDNESFIEKRKSNGNRTAALGSRPFDPINNTVKFNIIKNGDGIPSICIGAAILSVLKKNNYTNCTGSKRGVYCIDQAMTNNWGSLQPSNEATFWNHDTQSPNSTIGFQFTQGDTIQMTIDYEMNQIIFEKDEQIFDMSIDCRHRDLYPFVCLSNTNSIVQILE